jgi:hypothetical protein
MIIVPAAYQNSNLTTAFSWKYNVIGEVFREEGVYETFEVLIIKALNYFKMILSIFQKKSKSFKGALWY